MGTKNLDDPYRCGPARSYTMREQQRAYEAMCYPDGTRIERNDIVDILGEGRCTVIGKDLGKGLIWATAADGHLVRATVEMVSAPV